MPLLLLFVLFALGELYVLIEVGRLIGGLATVALTVLTAAVGIAMVRHQGFDLLRRAQIEVDRGEQPVREVFDGLCLLIAGLCLLVPGFVTDAFGFLLLVPAFRSVLGQRLWDGVGRHGHVIIGGPGRRSRRREPPEAGRPQDKEAPVIEGDYRRIDEETAGDGGDADNKDGKAP